jgi:hypothetical protein
VTEWLLLCDPSPVLRHRVLTELLDAPGSDPEAADLAGRRLSSPEVTELLAAEPGEDLKDVFWLLCRLGYHGLDNAHPRVAELAERLFDRQHPDGSFPLHEFRHSDTYSTIPLQTSLPLRGLAAVGYATDPRAERAYEWLLAQRLDDGAWPTGRAAGQTGYVAGYRSLPGSSGCRANTQAAIACLVLHPQRCRAEPTRRALDLLLQRETRDEWTLGTEVSRLRGLEPPAGFLTFYARFDLAFILDLASRAGATLEDQRVDDLVGFLLRHRGPAGLWEHPTHPELTRWLTFDLLLSLRRLAGGDWAGVAPRLPFRPYRRGRRY